jgi:FMN-dependent NADH-azoreductase
VNTNPPARATESTPREGWDHASAWLPHGLSPAGLVPTFIEAELTLAETVPALTEFIPLAMDSLRAAHQTIDSLWRDPSLS